MKVVEFIFGKAFNQEDFITADKFFSFGEENKDWIQYIKTDTLFHPIENWRGRNLPLFYPQKPIVISGHSDFPIKQEYLNHILRSPVKFWFATNADCEHTNVFGIPHGLTNDSQDTDIHPIHGNQKILCDVLSKERLEPKHLVYMNFSVNTDMRTERPVRQILWNTFSQLPFVFKRECTSANMNLIDRKQYLEDMYSSKFVLCPQGNGIDTVRLWEAIYCRCIPIVMRHRAMRYFSDLPILWINDWTEVMDPTYLQKEYQRIICEEWNMDAMKIGYWKKKIETLYKEE